MDLKELKKNEFIEELLSNLNSIGISTYNVQCILAEGSALYLDNPNDIDLKIIVKRYNDKAETLKIFTIQNYKVECCYYTFRDWASVMSYRKAYFIVESPDMICIYGDDSDFKRFDPVNDSNVKKYIVDIYNDCFFNYSKKKKGSFELNPKRLWNFLLFAYKVLNKSNTLSKEQLATVQKAHDLELDKEEFRELFNEIKELVYNE